MVFVDRVVLLVRGVLQSARFLIFFLFFFFSNTDFCSAHAMPPSPSRVVLCPSNDAFVQTATANLKVLALGRIRVFRGCIEVSLHYDDCQGRSVLVLDDGINRIRSNEVLKAEADSSKEKDEFLITCCSASRRHTLTLFRESLTLDVFETVVPTNSLNVSLEIRSLDRVSCPIYLSQTLKLGDFVDKFFPGSRRFVVRPAGGLPGGHGGEPIGVLDAQFESYLRERDPNCYERLFLHFEAYKANNSDSSEGRSESEKKSGRGRKKNRTEDEDDDDEYVGSLSGSRSSSHAVQPPESKKPKKGSANHADNGESVLVGGEESDSASHPGVAAETEEPEVSAESLKAELEKAGIFDKLNQPPPERLFTDLSKDEELMLMADGFGHEGQKAALLKCRTNCSRGDMVLAMFVGRFITAPAYSYTDKKGKLRTNWKSLSCEVYEAHFGCYGVKGVPLFDYKQLSKHTAPVCRVICKLAVFAPQILTLTFAEVRKNLMILEKLVEYRDEIFQAGKFAHVL